MSRKQWFCVGFLIGWLVSVVVFETWLVPQVWPRTVDRLPPTTRPCEE